MSNNVILRQHYYEIWYETRLPVASVRIVSFKFVSLRKCVNPKKNIRL